VELLILYLIKNLNGKEKKGKKWKIKKRWNKIKKMNNKEKYKEKRKSEQHNKKLVKEIEINVMIFHMIKEKNNKIKIYNN
jgi:hypothetical protein